MCFTYYITSTKPKDVPSPQPICTPPPWYQKLNIPAIFHSQFFAIYEAVSDTNRTSKWYISSIPNIFSNKCYNYSPFAWLKSTSTNITTRFAQWSPNQNTNTLSWKGPFTVIHWSPKAVTPKIIFSDYVYTNSYSKLSSSLRYFYPSPTYFFNQHHPPLWDILPPINTFVSLYNLAHITHPSKFYTYILLPTHISINGYLVYPL